MKKLFVIMMAVCFTVICMTGCLGDDTASSNYHILTSTEKATIMNNMVGDYSGYVKYSVNSTTTDSVEAKWTINNDTTISFKYPVSLLANFVDTAAVEIHDALKSAPDQTLTLNFVVPNATYNTIWDNYWQYGKYIPLLYTNEGTKKFTNKNCSFTLSYDNYYDIINYGYYNFVYYNSKCQGYIRPTTLIVTNSNGVNSTLELNIPTVFSGKK